MNPLETTSGSQPGGNREVVGALMGVTKTFDSYLTRALSGVNLEIRKGEVFGVFGPGGSGKSTTLKMLAGRLRPTEGKVKVFGRSSWRSSAKARIGFLAATGSVADRSGWFGFLGRIFGGNPGGRNGAAGGAALGVQSRPGLAQAVLGSRDLVILDEPFAGLDAAGRLEVLELIRTLRQRGKTVVFSSEVLTDANGLCDRLAIYYEGKIQAVGTLDELLSTPDAIRFTAPVLPRATAEQVLNLIREETSSELESATAAREPLRNTPPAQPQKTPRAEPAVTATAAEAVLAPLLQPATPAAPVSPGQETEDPVDHQKLEELTRPAARSAPAKTSKRVNKS